MELYSNPADECTAGVDASLYVGVEVWLLFQLGASLAGHRNYLSYASSNH